MAEGLLTIGKHNTVIARVDPIDPARVGEAVAIAKRNGLKNIIFRADGDVYVASGDTLQLNGVRRGSYGSLTLIPPTKEVSESTSKVTTKPKTMEIKTLEIETPFQGLGKPGFFATFGILGAGAVSLLWQTKGLQRDVSSTHRAVLMGLLLITFGLLGLEVKGRMRTMKFGAFNELAPKRSEPASP